MTHNAHTNQPSLWQRLSLQLRAHQPFPAPGTCNGGPTYLARYPDQYKLFRDKLPYIVARQQARRERTLTVGIIGSSTGEEMASVLASVIRAFDEHPAWGQVQTWRVEVRGLELDPGLCAVARRRLAGWEPLLAHEQHLAHSAGYQREVEATMAALNQHPRWTKRSFRYFAADAYADDGLRDLRGSDALFFNSVFLNKDRLATGAQLARDFAHTYLFSTEAPSGFPPMGAGKTHHFELFSDGSRRLQLTVATPMRDVEAAAPGQQQRSLEEAQARIRVLLGELEATERKLAVAQARIAELEAEARTPRP